MMARKSVLKFSSIVNFFLNENNMIKKGENAVESGHIASFYYDADAHFIKGTVYASMKAKSYSVEVLLKENFDIQSATCECPRGQVRCHHMAALLLHAHYNISVTDKQCAWSNKQDPKKKDGAIKSVDELFPAKKFKACPNIPSDLKERTFEMLKKQPAIVGFSWLLSPETQGPSSTQVNLPNPRDVIFSQEFETSLDKEEFFLSKMKLSDEEISSAVNGTKGQAGNWLWSVLRSDRLTSSHFGAILGACRRNSFPPSLFKKLLSTYNLDGVKAVQWGKDHEVDGASSFQTANSNLETTETGLWLHKSGILGASPDRLVTFPDGSIGTVEIKCPFKYRNELLSEALTKDKKYVVFNENGQYALNFNHDIYHQIQGQMHIVNCPKGYLVLWTLKESLIFEIHRDETWANNFSILQNFYLKHFLPHILENP